MARVLAIVVVVVLFGVGGLIYNTKAAPNMRKEQAYHACMYDAGNYSSLTSTRCHRETGW